MERVRLTNIYKEFNVGYNPRETTFQRINSILLGRLASRSVFALKNINLSLDAGEIVGLIGQNGSGKTTLLRVISDIYQLYAGSVFTAGKIVPLIGLGFNLDARLTLFDNTYLAGSFLGLKSKEIKERLSDIIAFAELESFQDTQLFKFSQGMITRFTISLALHADPDILLIDEMFTFEDQRFQAKTKKRIKEIVERGACVILASHSLETLNNYCTKVVWLQNGEIKLIGSPDDVISTFQQKTNNFDFSLENQRD